MAIHGVHYLRVEHNVGYHTIGHMYFIEDAIETKNVLNHNLAVLSFAASALLNSDQFPALFWITNADNVLRSNSAAGGLFYGCTPHWLSCCLILLCWHAGIWYRTLSAEGVTGVSAHLGFGKRVCPEHTPLLEFSNNVVHSW